jgi:REP element-mobilizing transposase RayT
MRKQLELNLNQGNWGGRRQGSGRKRLQSQGVAHRRREKVTTKTPLHINFKFKTSIRNKASLRLLKRAIINARTHGLRILHYSLQPNHVHLIIEAKDNNELTTGMKSLTVTFAKGLHKGRVQVQRYHLHVLKTIREVKHAIHYVLFNQQKHEKGTYSTIDGYSSILQLKVARELIKKFCLQEKMSLKVLRVESFHMDKERSYLAIMGLRQLVGP